MMNKPRKALSEIPPPFGKPVLSSDSSTMVSSAAIVQNSRADDKENPARSSQSFSNMCISSSKSSIIGGSGDAQNAAASNAPRRAMRAMRVPASAQYNYNMDSDDDWKVDGDDDDKAKNNSGEEDANKEAESESSVISCDDLSDRFNNTTSIASLAGDRDDTANRAVSSGFERRRALTDGSVLFYPYASHTDHLNIRKTLPQLSTVNNAGESAALSDKTANIPSSHMMQYCESLVAESVKPSSKPVDFLEMKSTAGSNQKLFIDSKRPILKQISEATLAASRVCKSTGGKLNHYHSTDSLANTQVQEPSVQSWQDQNSLTELGKVAGQGSALAVSSSNSKSLGLHSYRDGAMRGVPASLLKLMRSDVDSADIRKSSTDCEVDGIQSFSRAKDESQFYKSVPCSSVGMPVPFCYTTVSGGYSRQTLTDSLRQKPFTSSTTASSVSSSVCSVTRCDAGFVYPSSAVTPAMKSLHAPTLTSTKPSIGESALNLRSFTPSHFEKQMLLSTPQPSMKYEVGKTSDSVLRQDAQIIAGGTNYRDRSVSRNNEQLGYVKTEHEVRPPRLSEYSYELLGLLDSKKKLSNSSYNTHTATDDNSFDYNYAASKNSDLSDCFASLVVDGITPLPIHSNDSITGDNSLKSDCGSDTLNVGNKNVEVNREMGRVGSTAMDSMIINKRVRGLDEGRGFAVPMPVHSAKKGTDPASRHDRSRSLQLDVPQTHVASQSSVHASSSQQISARSSSTQSSIPTAVNDSLKPKESHVPIKGSTTLYINDVLYILIKVIGTGGSSKVYHAISEDGRNCAVKCVNLDDAEESTINGFKNEINLLQKLQDHEEIVRLYDYMFEEISNTLYVVMEKGDMDLAAYFRVKRGNMNVRRLLVKPFWIEMIQAVHILHQQGIVHSDLKPANFIMVCGQVKLIDFGIAKSIQADKTSVTCDQMVGTLNYMSPEAVIDHNGGRDLTGAYKPHIKISTKSDVWSLGCILYLLVYGRVPFDGVRNQFMKLQAIINPNHTIEFPPCNDSQAVDILKKCLDRNPRNRPSIDELLDHPYVAG